MNVKMDANEPRTGSPNGGTRGADYVFHVFRQNDSPVSKLIWPSVILQINFFGGLLAAIPTGGITLIVSLLAMFALPFFPGVFVRREFASDVIPACRPVCTEKEIVSGAMKSLRFMFGRYLRCLLPGILIFYGLIFFFRGGLPLPRYFVSAIWVYLLQIAVFFLGEYVLAWYPVARVFSQRAGMVVLMLVVFLAQIVLAFDFLYAASGLVHMDYNADCVRLVARSIVTLVVCAAIYGVGLWYFTRAAFADAGQDLRDIQAFFHNRPTDEERESNALAAFFGRKSK